MANEVDQLYVAHRTQIRQALKGMKHISFTLDAWTSPNQKAFMAVTAHGISADWKMMDVVVGMPAVEGKPAFFFSLILTLEL
jgi:hypothetical protein